MKRGGCRGTGSTRIGRAVQVPQTGMRHSPHMEPGRAVLQRVNAGRSFA